MKKILGSQTSGKFFKKAILLSTFLTITNCLFLEKAKAFSFVPGSLKVNASVVQPKNGDSFPKGTKPSGDGSFSWEGKITTTDETDPIILSFRRILDHADQTKIVTNVKQIEPGVFEAPVGSGSLSLSVTPDKPLNPGNYFTVAAARLKEEPSF